MTLDMSDPSPASGVAITSSGGRVSGVTDGATTTFRPRLALRLAGPAVVALGLGAIGLNLVLGVVVMLAGALLCVAWVPKVDCTRSFVRYRGPLETMTLAFADVSEVRLRRVPFGRPRPPGRTLRFGRFSTIPIRLRVVAGEEMIQLTVVFWGDWGDLVRAMLAIPGIESDARTRGRLDRYG
jgi:hypothetical protein